MNVACLQHVPFEGPGFFADCLARRGDSLSVYPLYDGTPVPAVEDADAFIIMGGPMSVHDTRHLPWLEDERSLIRDAAQAGKPVLGICLGGQQISMALGGTVTRNPEREIGWFDVTRNLRAEDHSLLAGIPERFAAFHWHGETFSAPPGARPLLASQACPNQAFAIGTNILALQFHLETTLEGARALVHHCAGEMTPGRWVQKPDIILGAESHFKEANTLASILLDNLLNAA